MDKKTIAGALVTVSVMILLIFLAVFFVNRDKLTGSGNSTVITPPATESGVEDDKAFLYDFAFLDEYQPFVAAEDMEIVYDKSLVLSASSVERDLRITILDAYGRVVTGEQFYVKVKGIGEYKDLDADGIIKIDGLRPGSYYVSLKEYEDYELPPEIKVSVKDKIEYTPIADISYLIKTEAEIVASEEDTKQAKVESDDTEHTEIWKDAPEGILGIDVSKWNKNIDWVAVKEDGVKFVIIRCGYRGSKTGALVEDPYFRQNIEGATEAGLKVGVYFFTQAVTEVEAVEEASMVLSLTKDYHLDYPIFIDTESAGGRADGLSVTDRTAICKAFCETIASAGEKAGIYASRNWYNTKIKDEQFDTYVKWLAEYREKPLYTGDYHIWQYTSSGKINGIEGRVDLNLGYYSP